MNTHDKYELPAEFRSGNNIPVERATITRERMLEILQAAIEADRQRNDNWRHAVMCAISHNDYETDAPRRVQQALRLLSDAFHGLPFRESIVDDLIADRQRRGEPVACFKCGHAKHGGECVNVAPQPAEPVKVPPATAYCQHPHCQTTGGCQGPCSKKQAEPVKVQSDDDSLTIAYMSGYHDGKRSMTPEGWQLVPKELTRNMMYAGVAEWLTRDDPEEDVQGIWKAMLAAAPKFGEEE